MQHWDRTTIVWNLRTGHATVIPVTDWPDKTEKNVHTLHGIRAVSMLERKWTLELNIHRVCIGPTDQREPIRKRLMVDLGGFLKTLEHETCHLHDVEVEPFAGVYKLHFSLGGGSQFCDMAIRVARYALTSLGVEDKSGYLISRFEITQETFVRLGTGWVSFAEWLRMQHRLPIQGEVETAA